MRLVMLAALTALLPSSASAGPGDRTRSLLQALSDAAGPPGFEEDVRRIMVGEMKPYGRISYDGLGSVIVQNGTAGPRVMLDAHMDELGGVTRRITKDGFLSMQMLGGWLDQALPGQRWIIIGAKGPVEAVTGIRDIHYTPAEERTKVIPRDEIFLDVGAKSDKDAMRLGLEPGDPVVPSSPFAELNGTGNYVGKAFDDRAGCAVVVEALRRLATSGHPNQLFVAATVQEEVGLRGAQAAAALIRPDVAIAIEGGVTGDAPGGHPEESQVRLGDGPGLFLAMLQDETWRARARESWDGAYSQSMWRRPEAVVMRDSQFSVGPSGSHVSFKDVLEARGKASMPPTRWPTGWSTTGSARRWDTTCRRRRWTTIERLTKQAYFMPTDHRSGSAGGAPACRWRGRLRCRRPRSCPRCRSRRCP